jgi:hypothetical protein
MRNFSIAAQLLRRSDMRTCALLLIFSILASRASAEPLPADSGIVNVRDFGARGDGRSDDTAAIVKAIAASGGDTGRAFWQDRIVYLPDGTYRVSGTLLKRYDDGRFGSGLILMGQSEAGTVIRLTDHAPGFADVTQSRAIVFTSSKHLGGPVTGGGRDYVGKGEGNDAYMNSVEDLTIDVGQGNPGAIAIDYLANNIGAIRRVTLRAPPGSGLIGLSMTRKWPGPALIRDMTVQGFATGIAIAQTEYGLTFEHIRLEGQTAAAIRNDDNSLAMHDVTISGPASVIANIGAKGLVAIADGQIQNAAALPFKNSGMMVLRDVRLTGGRVLNGTLAGTQWTDKPHPAGMTPPLDTPAPPGVTLSRWANATTFGAVPDPARDSTDGLRRAFASGAEVIYLPHGTYAISDSIAVPATVRRILGMHSTLKILAARQPGFSRTSGMLRIATGGQPVSIERLAFDNTNMGQQLAIEVAAARDVVIKDVVAAGVGLLDRKQEGGRVFLENVCCGRMQTAGPAPVFARQFDTEGGGTRVTNLGSPLWLLGLKTEGITTIVENHPGAHTDIFGGLVYMVRSGPPVPAFSNDGGWLSACFAEESLQPGSHYEVYLADQSRNVAADSFPPRGLAHFVPDLTAAPIHQ